MAVRGVLAQADVAGDEEAGEGAAEEADAGDDGALRVVGGGAEGVFGGRGERDAEEDDALEALGDERLQEGHELVEADAALARQAGDGGHLVRVVGDEDGVDEHALGQLALGLPDARERVRVAAVQLRRDVAADAHAGSGGRGIGAGT